MRALRADLSVFESGVSFAPEAPVLPENVDPVDSTAQKFSARVQAQEPCLFLPVQGQAPVDEYSAKGFVTLAFPHLFPLVRGDYDEVRRYPLTRRQYAAHLHSFKDGRFAMDARFPYFVLNWLQRTTAH